MRVVANKGWKMDAIALDKKKVGFYDKVLL